jgi:hypothetical protein
VPISRSRASRRALMSPDCADPVIFEGLASLYTVLHRQPCYKLIGYY